MARDVKREHQEVGMRNLFAITLVAAVLVGAAAEAGVYRVVNVDESDVLNIRAAPDAGCCST